MSFNPKLKQGQVLTNLNICNIFKCSQQGGMRRSKKTNSLVLVSDHTKGIYEDRWKDDIFHYTGMGLTGNQSLTFAQNKTLLESETNGVDIFLFEVFLSGKYYYQGRVGLVKSPYQEKQLDIKGKIRDVWIFTLKLVDTKYSASISEDVFQKKLLYKEKQAKKLSTEELKKRVKSTPRKCGTRHVTSKQYDRNQDVAELVKRNARGKCQLCDATAPFKNKKDEPYLETHHIEWLSKGGEDTVFNTVALCPNCHRKMHILNLEKDKAYLRKQALAAK